MSDFIYDATSLPTGKADAGPLTGPSNQSVVATEWNSVMQALLDTRSAIVSGQYHSLASTPSAAVSTSGAVRLRSNSGVFEISQDGASYTSVVTVSGNLTVNGTKTFSSAPTMSAGLAIVSQLVTSGTAAPVSGTYAKGTVVFNSDPTPGGSVGWICTTAGTPGTWKEFGLISL